MRLRSFGASGFSACRERLRSASQHYPLDSPCSGARRIFLATVYDKSASNGRAIAQPRLPVIATLDLRNSMQVSYFYDPECFKADGFTYGPTAVYYGYRHPMKPHRIGMTHSLLMNSAFWPSLQVRTQTLSQ